MGRQEEKRDTAESKSSPQPAKTEGPPGSEESAGKAGRFSPGKDFH